MFVLYDNYTVVFYTNDRKLYAWGPFYLHGLSLISACQAACQISKQLECLKMQSRGFETL